MHQTVVLLLALAASASAYVTPDAMPLWGARSVRNASVSLRLRSSFHVAPRRCHTIGSIGSKEASQCACTV